MGNVNSGVPPQQTRTWALYVWLLVFLPIVLVAAFVLWCVWENKRKDRHRLESDERRRLADMKMLVAEANYALEAANDEEVVPYGTNDY
ncbi:MAG: uncharacterized protein KVP18_000038 [Porospora cf. gigantea A]|uniref:uncharacterized protein n=1 Tax=Porospora cf. gigantea A TaxID=2853593 RepID=UPI003559A4CE|nr:MAG: hypothetical protein KVP18_000038 [Porospora cf. gigantea A]